MNTVQTPDGLCLFAWDVYGSRSWIMKTSFWVSIICLAIIATFVILEDGTKVMLYACPFIPTLISYFSQPIQIAFDPQAQEWYLVYNRVLKKKNKPIGTFSEVVISADTRKKSIKIQRPRGTFFLNLYAEDRDSLLGYIESNTER